MDLFNPPAHVQEEHKALIARAKDLRRQRDLSSWEEADIYAKLAQDGMTQAAIAKACGIPQSSVSKFVACTKLFSLNNRPPFWEAFKQVNSEKPVKETGQEKKLCMKCAKDLAAGRKPPKKCQQCVNIRAGRAANDNGEGEQAEEGEAGDKPKEKPAKEKKPEPTLAEKIKRECSRLKWVSAALKTRAIERELFFTVKKALQTIHAAIPALCEAPVKAPEDDFCKRCKAEITWVTTEGHARMPVDRKPRIGGRFEIMPPGVAVYVDFDKTQARYAHHDCPGKEVL